MLVGQAIKNTLLNDLCDHTDKPYTIGVISDCRREVPYQNETCFWLLLFVALGDREIVNDRNRCMLLFCNRGGSV
jgi:hypothetical protein